MQGNHCSDANDLQITMALRLAELSNFYCQTIY